MQSCPTLCNLMNRSTPGLPVHHQLPDFTQTHVHCGPEAGEWQVRGDRSSPAEIPALVTLGSVRGWWRPELGLHMSLGP